MYSLIRIKKIVWCANIKTVNVIVGSHYGVSVIRWNNPPGSRNSRVDYFFCDISYANAITVTISEEKLIMITSISNVVTLQHPLPSGNSPWSEQVTGCWPPSKNLFYYIFNNTIHTFFRRCQNTKKLIISYPNVTQFFFHSRH